MSARTGRWVVRDGQAVRLCDVESCDRLARFRNDGRAWDRWCGGHQARVLRARRGLMSYGPVEAPIRVRRVATVPARRERRSAV